MEKKKTYVGQSVVKRDAMALMTGKPVYTDDIAPKDCLIVKVLRSPHAHAWIEEIDKTRALSVPGIETILTWEDSPPEAVYYGWTDLSGAQSLQSPDSGSKNAFCGRCGCYCGRNLRRGCGSGAEGN